MSHIARSVCLCVGVFGPQVSYAKMAEPIEMPFRADICGSKKQHIRWGSRFPHRKGHFSGGHVPVCYNVPTQDCIAHCSPAVAGAWTNAFSTARGDKTAMWPLLDYCGHLFIHIV